MKNIVEISVGTIFSETGDPSRTHLIIDTGKEDWFGTIQCKINEDSVSIPNSFIAGISELKNIGLIVKKIEPIEVSQLLAKHMKEIDGKDVGQRTLERINQAINSESKRINLD
jgi:hypothetical protein